MNTIRFFLLLVSVFFFAFLFQTNAFHTSGKSGDVLSGKSTSRTIISSTPFSKEERIHQELFLKLRYPGSSLQKQEDTRETLVSGDSTANVIMWYADRLNAVVPDENIINTKNQKVLITGWEKKNEITVQIKKENDKRFTSIVISVTAP